MKYFNAGFRLLLSIIFFMTLIQVYGQVSNKNDSIANRLKTVAIKIISSARFCAFVTIDQQGKLIARTMDPFLPDSNFVIWLGTNPRSRKVQEIKKNQDVCLYYPDSSAQGYVVIQGKAIIVNDETEKKIHWKNEWSAFYKNRDKDFILIKVRPSRLEVLSYKDGVTGNSITSEVPFINF